MQKKYLEKMRRRLAEVPTALFLTFLCALLCKCYSEIHVQKVKQLFCIKKVP